MSIKIVKKGSWLYDGTINKPVDIVALDYDFWYEIAKEERRLEPNEKPGPFSPEGFIYYVRFDSAGQISEPTWVDSVGQLTIEDSMNEAQKKVQSKIQWV